MEKTSRRRGEETVVAVCLTGGQKSKYILKWAFEKFVPEGDVLFKLVHVYPKIHLVPTPMGGWLPITQVRESLASDYRQEMKKKKETVFLPYQEALKSKEVKSEIVVLESDDVAMAISSEVAKHSIRHLVVGFSSSRIFSRKHLSWRKLMGENLSSNISETAPSFCSVYVIADRRLQQMRPADSEPAAINIDDVSGLSIISTVSSTFSLKLGCRQKSEPPSPRHLGSAASDYLASATQHRELEALPRHYDQGGFSNIKADDNMTNFTSSYPSAINQSSSSSDSWVSNRTSPEGSSVGVTPPGLSPLGSFLDTTPVESFMRTPTKGSAMDTPVGTPPNLTYAGTSGVSFADTPSSSSVSTSPKHRTPKAASPGLVSELDKLIMELRYLEQMHELTQNSDINEKFLFPLDELTHLSKQRVEEAITLKEQRAKDLASLQQSKPEVAQIEAREQDQRKSPQSRAETKAANEAKENENKLKQLNTGSQYQKFTWKEIVEATSSFSDEFKIGQGAFGTVYKCKLYRTTVAVKVLRTKDSATNKQFLQELEILSTIRHPHLLLLLGAVPEQSCLVYEYMDNGSLDDSLLRKNGKPPLPWYDRFRICCEVAGALAFLHNTKPRPIIHRDLKPANILLDHNLVSKIGDAGLGTMLNVEPTNNSLKTLYKDTTLVGTICYIDPEYQRTGRVSTKSDTYALGMVILQLLTAKSAVGIAYMMEEAIDEGNLSEVLDPEAGEWPAKETLEMALIGLQCAELSGKDRPDLTEKVLPALERLKEIADSARESASSASKAPPAHFICPILKDVMDDPYVAADGYTYDHKAIEEWLAENNTSPTTNLPLPHKFIVPNTTLLEAIKQWRSKTPAK